MFAKTYPLVISRRYGTWATYRWLVVIYPSKTVIFHGYIEEPEGISIRLSQYYPTIIPTLNHLKNHMFKSEHWTSPEGKNYSQLSRTIVPAVACCMPKGSKRSTMVNISIHDWLSSWPKSFDLGYHWSKS